MFTVAEPLALVPAGGGCDLMSRRPRCSMLEAFQEHKMLCFWLSFRGQQIKKINKLLISANYRGQMLKFLRLHRNFPRDPALDRHRIVL